MEEWMPGDILGGRYEIVEKIGCGGMAYIYKAKCLKLNRFVAIKVLKPEFRDDPEFVESFNIESAATASLSHENIVSVYDVGKEDGNVNYIVMEYVDGVTLKKYIEQNGALDWRKALDFAIQICSALEHSHNHHVIHKDIKPQNIMVTEGDILKITDFGIAKATSTQTVKISANTMGSVHYLSPEQARGGYVDEKSDIYSLGVVMYEMLTGKVPFDATTPVSVALMHVENTPTSITELKPDVPLIVENIVCKAMSKEQAKRYQNASLMLADLKMAHDTADTAQAAVIPPFDAETSPTVRMKPISTSKETEAVLPVNKTPQNQNEKNKKGKKKKAPMTRSDKIAVIAALVTACLVIWAVYDMFWPTIASIFSDDGEQKEMMVEVPPITGMERAKAESDVEGLGLKLTVTEEKYSADVSKNCIISQEPKAGEKVEKDTEIKVVVSLGSESFELPNVINKDRSQAVSELEDLGLEVEIVSEESENFPADTVLKQVPDSGTTVKAGDKVMIYVNTIKANQTKVPNLEGMTKAEAEKELSDASLVLGKITEEYSDTVEKDRIIRQAIKADSKIEKQTKVNVVMSLGPKPEESPSPSPSPSAEPSPSPSPSPSGGADNEEVTKEIQIKLPQDGPNKIYVDVRVNGSQVFYKEVSKSDEVINLTLKGKKGETKEVSVYFDGELKVTQSITLN